MSNYSPLDTYALPLDRTTRNAWCRFYAKTDPIVNAALNHHTDMACGQIIHECPDRYINKYFQDIYTKLNLEELIREIVYEYWRLGDVFILGSFDNEIGQWSSFHLLDPDYIDVQRSMAEPLPTISLIPDSELIKLIKAGDPKVESLGDEIKLRVLKGETIPLPNDNITQISCKSSVIETFGTSLITSSFKSLLLKDEECKLALEQRRSVDQNVLDFFNLEIKAGMRYTDSEVSNEIIERKYRNIRSMIKNWIEKKVYAPIAEAHGFYHADLSKISSTRKPGDSVPKILMYPKIKIV